METRTVDLGPCHCPNTPHERDEALVIEPVSMTYGTQRRVRAANDLERRGEADGSDRWGGLADATLMALCTYSWNLTDESGRTRPIGIGDPRSLASLDNIDPQTALALHEVFFPTPASGQEPDQRYAFRALYGAVLPNPPSAPSVDGPPVPSSIRPSPKGSAKTRRVS